MPKSSLPGIKGQAAALDLAIFVAICILALSFLFIQSARSTGSTGFIEENENINEVAIRAVSALAQSSAGVEIKTLQTVALKNISSCLSDDIRTIMGYADRVLEKLEEMEKKAESGDIYDISEDPFVIYLSARIDDISFYISKSLGIVNAAAKLFSDADSELATVCSAIDSLSQLFPGYDDLDISCGGLASSFLDNISESLSEAGEEALNLKSLVDGMESVADSIEQGLAEEIRQIRCNITKARDAASQFLGYLETGIDPDISFMELLPVDANVQRMTVEKLLSDAITAKGGFVFADESRSITGSAALLFTRGRDLGDHMPELDRQSQETSDTLAESYEGITLLPKDPLEELTNYSARGPYYEFTFAPQAYLTQAGSLGVRLAVSGGLIGGTKQKTEYFQDLRYILNSSVYPASAHHRTYNGSFVKGLVTENPVSITSKDWSDAEQITAEITSETRFEEQRVLRPMEADLSLFYENLTWPQAKYSFDIEHFLVSKESDYTINTSPRDCSRYNASDAEKSILLGILSAGRSDLMGAAQEAVAKRLDELLEGYHYKFEVRDCCDMVLSINQDAEPVGREGVAKRYFDAGGSRAEMTLTVWR